MCRKRSLNAPIHEAAERLLGARVCPASCPQPAVRTAAAHGGSVCAAGQSATHTQQWESLGMSRKKIPLVIIAPCFYNEDCCSLVNIVILPNLHVYTHKNVVLVYFVSRQAALRRRAAFSLMTVCTLGECGWYVCRTFVYLCDGHAGTGAQHLIDGTQDYPGCLRHVCTLRVPRGASCVRCSLREMCCKPRVHAHVQRNEGHEQQRDDAPGETPPCTRTTPQT